MEKLRKYFGKKDEAAFKALEHQFSSTLRRSDAEFLSLVGVEGRTKGIDIIHILAEDAQVSRHQMKLINAKLVELFIRYKTLNFIPPNVNKGELEVIEYKFQNQSFCIYPIHGNSKFVITANAKNQERIKKDITKIRVNLFKLQSEIEAF